ncbi:hypothetical protein PQU94_00980 [Asticcacaulis sp. DXS10W]|uniref:Uncharacterized protein n=1 Tax=Asticcacaulis currens TaxID=2984210 RepID=A0ABT5IBL1_9CAUL|nr:hypothetical protein [Asticcacaulis currens]MDC7692846.1 hypothetical protein [Asticcacaulis currens]
MTLDLGAVDLWAWTGHFLMAALVIWALWRGEVAERLSALIIFVGWSLTPMVQSVGVIGLDPGTTLVDVIATICLIWLSERERKLWLLLASACALLGTTGHFASEISPPTEFRAYFLNNGFWSGYMLLLALFIGMLNAERGRMPVNSQG